MHNTLRRAKIVESIYIMSKVSSDKTSLILLGSIFFIFFFFFKYVERDALSSLISVNESRTFQSVYNYSAHDSLKEERCGGTKKKK